MGSVSMLDVSILINEPLVLFFLYALKVILEKD